MFLFLLKLYFSKAIASPYKGRKGWKSKVTKTNSQYFKVQKKRNSLTRRFNNSFEGLIEIEKKLQKLVFFCLCHMITFIRVKGKNSFWNTTVSNTWRVVLYIAAFGMQRSQNAPRGTWVLPPSNNRSLLMKDNLNNSQQINKAGTFGTNEACFPPALFVKNNSGQNYWFHFWVVFFMSWDLLFLLVAGYFQLMLKQKAD